MLPFANSLEQSFTSMEKLREFISSQDRQEYETPICKILLSEDGVLKVGRFEGQLTRSAVCGLLNTEGIPRDFALEHCPEDLLVTIVQRLSRQENWDIRIQSVNGVATAIMPANRQPVRHDMLIERLGMDFQIKEATLNDEGLRILTIKNEPTAILPNDSFGFGWELINREDGWHSTEAWRFVIRQICSNGMVGFDKAAVFRRTYNSREPVLKSIEELVRVIENAVQLPELEPAIKWAAEKQLGPDHGAVVNYLAHMLEGDATKLALNDITPDSSWYELLNNVTALARIHTLEMRRRYEGQGGILLNWFLRKGRGRPAWQKASCDTCEYWRND